MHSAVNKGFSQGICLQRINFLKNQSKLLGEREIVDLLIENNALINIADNYGQTPLHWTAVNGNSMQFSDEVHLITIKKIIFLNKVARISPNF